MQTAIQKNAILIYLRFRQLGKTSKRKMPKKNNWQAKYNR